MSKKYYDRLAKSSGFSNKQFESEFGLKILKKFGWAEGKGLGKNEDGRDECLQQSRRDGSTGLGVEKKAPNEAQWENWWSDCYNDVAKKISEKKRAPSSSSPSASPEPESSSDSDSDDKGSSATSGGHVTAIKSASRMAGKLKRVLRQEAPKEQSSLAQTKPTKKETETKIPEEDENTQTQKRRKEEEEVSPSPKKSRKQRALQ